MSHTHNNVLFDISTKLCHIQHWTCHYIHQAVSYTAWQTLLHTLGNVTHSIAHVTTSLGCVTHSIAHVTRYLGCVTYSITLCATYARPCHMLIASHTSQHLLGYVPHTLLHPIGYVTHRIAHVTTSIGLCHIQHCTLCYIH